MKQNSPIIHLILSLCSLWLLSCSPKSDNIQLTCEQESDTTACRSQSAELRQKQLNQCFNDICGKKEDFLSMTDIHDLAQKRDHYKPSSNLYQSVEKAVNKKIEFSQRTSKQIIKTLTHYFSQEDLQLTPKQKAAYNRSFFINFYQTAYALEHPKKTPKLFLPTSEVYKKLEIAEKDQRWLESLFASSLFEGLPKQLLSRHYGISFLKEDYPGLELNEAIKQAATTCLSIHKNIKEKLGIPYPAFDQARDGICHHVLNSPKSIINMNIFTRQVQNAKLLNYFFHDGLDEFWLAREVDPKKALIRFTATPLFGLAKNYNNVDFSTDKEAQRQIRYAINTCHHIIGSAYETAPNKIQREKAHILIDKIKSMSKEKFQFNDPKIDQFFAKKIDQLEFEFPMFRKDYEHNVIEIFKVWQKDLKKMASIKSPSSLLTALMIFGAPTFKYSQDKPKPTSLTQGIASFQQINSLCSLFASQTFGDHFYTGTGTAYLSWNAINHLDIGFGIAAHETGHAISSALQKIIAKWPGHNYGRLPGLNPLWERRSCIDQLHKDAGRVPTGERQFTEEDWADYFAANIIKDYRGEEVRPKNYACSMVNEIFGTLAIGLGNSASGKHSAVAFRALHIHKTLNKGIPSSCTKALESKQIPACF